MGDQRTFDRFAFPPQCRGRFFILSENQLDVVMLTDPMAFFLEPSDAFPELIDTLGGTRAREPRGEFIQLGLKAFHKTFGDTFLFPGPTF